MVKIFSVDWLAQSHCENIPTQDDFESVNDMPTVRPHVPCMVQPRAPTSFEKCYLQPKPKTSRSQFTTHQVTSLSLPTQPADCSLQNFSENSGYSSGYESEAASSECASVEEGSEHERDGAHRRLRTKFTPLQIHKLEKIFNKHKYLDAGDRVKTATKLCLSETQVRTWFQNRRMKLKREVNDLRAEYLAPTLPPMMFQHVPSLQFPRFTEQLLQYTPSNLPMYPATLPQIPTHHMLTNQPIHPMMHYPHFH